MTTTPDLCPTCDGLRTISLAYDGMRPCPDCATPQPDTAPRTATRRAHPAEVTAERLLGHVERWHDKFTPQERDALALVRFALFEIADGIR